MNEPAPAPTSEPERAADSVGRDVLLALVGELQQQKKKPFGKMSAEEQDQIIDRLREVVRGALTRGFALMATGGFPHVPATLEKVEFNAKGVNGKLALASGSEHRHALADHAARPVVIVLTSPDTYSARMSEVRGQSDQKDLFASSEQAAKDRGDASGFDAPRHDVGTDKPDEPAAPPQSAGPDVAAGGGIPAPDAASIDDLHPGELTVEIVCDALALVNLESTYGSFVVAWTQEQRAAVIDFCGALHLKETGADVTVPARPDVLGEVGPGDTI